MTHSLDRATAFPPATVGQGCTLRYDPDALDEQAGTEFPGAHELWEAVYPAQSDAPKPA